MCGTVADLERSLGLSADKCGRPGSLGESLNGVGPSEAIFEDITLDDERCLQSGYPRDECECARPRSISNVEEAKESAESNSQAAAVLEDLYHERIRILTTEHVAAEIYLNPTRNRLRY